MSRGRAALFHACLCVLHTGLASWIVYLTTNRHLLIAGGVLPLTCMRPNATITREERAALRAASPQVVDDACATYDFLAVSLALHVLTAVAHGWYTTQGTSYPWRWAEYTVSAPIVFVHSAITTGTRDVGTLVCIFTATAGAMVFGLLWEHVTLYGSTRWHLVNSPTSADDDDNSPDGPQDKPRHTPPTHPPLWVTHQLPPWVLVGGALASILWNYANNAAGAPTFVHAILGVECVLLTMFGVINACASRLTPQTSDTAYAVLSVSSKCTLTLIFIVAIMN